MRYLLLLFFFPMVFSWYAMNGKIYDEQDNMFPIRGINWYGMEEPNGVVEGLWARNLSSHIYGMYDEGFNVIRIPFSLKGIFEIYPHPIRRDLISQCNECNTNCSGFDILDMIFDIMQNNYHGLYIILDFHRLDLISLSPLWYNGIYSERIMLDGWKIMLDRYAGYDCLLGIDLFNEPHNQATFDTGDIATDWKLFVRKSFDELHPLIPDKLFFVNGINWGEDFRAFTYYNTDDWFSEDEKKYIIISPHSYGPIINHYPVTTYEHSKYHWDLYFGFLKSNWTLVIGEWGSNDLFSSERLWMTYFVRYLLENQQFGGWIFWAWNPNSRDVRGYLGPDWETPNPFKKQLLSELLNA